MNDWKMVLIASKNFVRNSKFVPVGSLRPLPTPDPLRLATTSLLSVSMSSALVLGLGCLRLHV